MKSLFSITLIFSLFLVSCGGSEEEQTEETTNETTTTNEQVEDEVEVIENSYSIESGTVGIFEIGKIVPDPLPEGLKMRQFLEIDVDDEGVKTEHTHNVVFNTLEDIVELIMEKDTEEHHEDKAIEEMMVLSNYYETPEGVVVGTTIEEFEEIYPDMTVWYDGVHKRYHLETGSITGAQFIFNELDIVKQAKGSKDFQEIDASYIKEGAKIEKIRIH